MKTEVKIDTTTLAGICFERWQGGSPGREYKVQFRSDKIGDLKLVCKSPELAEAVKELLNAAVVTVEYLSPKDY